MTQSVQEVMVHVAEERLEMAVLMSSQAEQDLASVAVGDDAELQTRVDALKEALAASRVRIVRQVESELAAGAGSQTARFCKLLCMLDQKAIAHEALLSYMVNTVEDVASALRVKLKECKGARFFVENASRVLTIAMDLVADHQGLLIQQFGVQSFFEAVLKLQKVLDSLFEEFFAAFLERRVTPAVLQVTSNDPKLDVMGLGTLLDEMTQLSLRCEIFSHFVDGANKDGLEYAKSTGEDNAPALAAHAGLAKTLAHSLVRRGNLEAMSNYVLLELHYLEASLQRTRQWEEHQAGEDKSAPRESDFINCDGFFFVLDRSCQRALQGRNAAIACSILSSCANHVELDLWAWLQEAWEGWLAVIGFVFFFFLNIIF
jgi:hypothetical protein